MSRSPRGTPDVNGEWHYRVPEARRKKQWEIVEDRARRWLAKEGAHVYIYEILGESIEKQGRIEEAIGYYETAWDTARKRNVFSERSLHLKRLDILYQKLRRFEDCLNLCQYYTDRYPARLDAWRRLRRVAKQLELRDLTEKAEKQILRCSARRIYNGPPLEPLSDAELAALATFSPDEIAQIRAKFQEDISDLAGLLEAQSEDEKVIDRGGKTKIKRRTS